MQHYIRLSAALVALTLVHATPVLAGGTVTDCSNDTDFLSKLSGGGAVTFACPPSTINVGTTATIAADTVIDGGDVIKLSGSHAVRLFAVNSGAILTLKHIELQQGYFNGSGGAIYNVGLLNLVAVTIRDSYAPLGGGAIFPVGSIDISDSTLANNKSGSGAAIHCAAAGAQIAIRRSVLQDNEVSNSDPLQSLGGAIYASGPLSITDTELARNKAGAGGAIFAALSATISNCSLHDNKVTNDYPNGNGGALLVGTGAIVRVSDSVLRNNNGQAGGALAVQPDAQLTVTDCTVNNNNSTNGGALNNHGGTALVSTTLSSNNGAHGGGIDNFGLLTLVNVTVSGSTGTYGGALKNEAGSANLVNVTLARNSAAYGGGIYNVSANTQLELTNVLIASNPDSMNCKFITPPSSAQFSLSSDDSCSFGSGRDGVDPLLGPLANNGGKTLTFLPQESSPAIDGGVAVFGVTTDQRGVERPQRVTFDVGAVEVGPPLPCANDAQCDDANACTADVCDPAGCRHDALPDCRPCQTVEDCDDHETCTTESCSAGKCASDRDIACEQPVEICGDCLDNDGDGLVDYADPDCCESQAMTVKRLVIQKPSARAQGNRLRLKAIYRQETPAGFDPTAQDTSLQLSDAGGLFVCQTIAGTHWKSPHAKKFGFSDRDGSFAGGLATGHFTVKGSGRVLFTTLGRKLTLRSVEGTAVDLTVRVGGQCSHSTNTLRSGQHALRFP